MGETTMALFGAPNIDKLKKKGDVDGLVRALGHTRPDIQAKAAIALGSLGDARAVQPLIDVIVANKDGLVRQRGTEALAQIGNAALESLVHLLEGRDSDLRFRAAARLGGMRDVRTAQQDTRVIEALMRRVEDQHEDEVIRDAAAIALGKLGDERAIPTLEAAGEASSERVRKAAAEGLHRLRGEGEGNAYAIVAGQWEVSASPAPPSGPSPERGSPAARVAARRHASTDSRAGDALAILDDAYLVRHDEELEARVALALDQAIGTGEARVALLVDRLFRDMRVEGSALRVSFGGDEAWNEWLRKRRIVEALGRARVRSVVPYLLALLGARSQVTDFYEILQPAVAQALGEIGDPDAIAPLRAALRDSNTREVTVRAIGQALEHLEGQAPADPELIVAEADSIYTRTGGGSDVIAVLDGIKTEAFDTLSPQDRYYVWFMRGESCLKLGDREKAVECYRMALEHLDDPNAVAHGRLRELGH